MADRSVLILLLLAVGGGPVLPSCQSPDSEDTTTPSVVERTSSTSLVGLDATGTTIAEHASADEFDFADDDICEWFTPEAMARIVAEAQQATDTTMGFGDNWTCTPHGWYSSLAEVELKRSIRNSPPGDVIGAFVGHDMLDDSVAYSGLDQAKSWWLIGIRAVLEVEGHDYVSFRYVADPTPATTDADKRTSLGFAIADGMLEEMKWVTSDDAQSPRP